MRGPDGARQKMGVVDHDDVVDLEFMQKDKNTVDFNKGLSISRRKERQEN